MPKKTSNKLTRRGSTRRTRRENLPRPGNSDPVSNLGLAMEVSEAKDEDTKESTNPNTTHRVGSKSTFEQNTQLVPPMDPLLIKEIRRIGLFGISILCMLIGVSIYLN